ncbi:hypothetical protein GCM10011410_32940 [Hoyosella rhizosphaerae]|uniref:Type VII secretion system protein EccE domain-containing protein n=1 Tax=Hoyosella rhizosphaerae TaxID=1755582 RepID=A0A916XKC6_9ACTN|nr:hypothetical protein GCM10011410_32940 [Hoyosella rhizosphaerae]
MESLVCWLTQRYRVSAMLTAQCIFFVVIAVGLVLEWPAVWAGFGAVCLALICLIPIRGRYLTSWLAIAATKTFSSHDQGGNDESVVALSRDVMQCNNGEACTVLEIVTAPIVPTATSPGAFAGAISLPVDELACALQQYDIALSGIEIIVRGRTTEPHHALGAAYSRMLSPLPVAAQRRAWIVVRLSPNDAPDAVRRRGGGTRGICGVLDIATKRIQGVLRDHEISTVLRTTKSLDAISDTLIPMDRVFGIAPSAINTGSLLHVWQPGAAETALNITIRPNHTSKQDPRGPQASYQVTAIAGLAHRTNNPDGVEPSKFPRTIPMAGFRPYVDECFRPNRMGSPETACGRDGTALLSISELAQLHVPVIGCGVLIGVDQAGRAVTAPIANRSGQRVSIEGRIQLLQQLVLRAAATGVDVRIASDRPHAWAQLTSPQSGSPNVALCDKPWPSSPTNMPHLLVLDGAKESHPALGDQPPGVTVLDFVDAMRDDLSPSQGVEYAIRIIQSNEDPHQLRLIFGHRHVDVATVSIPEETDYLLRSQSRRVLAG